MTVQCRTSVETRFGFTAAVGGALNLAFSAGRELKPWRREGWVQDINDRLLALMSSAEQTVAFSKLTKSRPSGKASGTCLRRREQHRQAFTAQSPTSTAPR